MAMPLMGVSHKESLKTVGVAIQAFAYDLNFKHWQDCVLKLLVSSPSLNCVKLYHWSTWSKCFKAVDKSGTTSHLRHTHTHTLLLPALPEVAGLGSMARAAARKSRVDSHLHLWTPDEVHGTRWGKVWGNMVYTATCMSSSWIYPFMIYLYVICIIDIYWS